MSNPTKPIKLPKPNFRVKAFDREGAKPRDVYIDKHGYEFDEKCQPCGHHRGFGDGYVGAANGTVQFTTGETFRTNGNDYTVLRVL